MKDTEVLLTLNTIESLRKLRGRKRHAVVQFLDELLLHPDIRGEFSEADDTGPELQVKVLGNVSVVYWFDSPVQEIKVLRIAALPGS